ncbi:MAG: hypothetical protein EA372_01305 [Chromatiaceae bacterium]|nr:MAG: hypothetical protein EA372_01305 [Chromatiaceae bacterium]
MIDTKRTIPADQADAGSVLAEDVRDRSGRLLLSAGIPLKDKHLRVLKTWGVTQVAIWQEAPASATDNTQPSREVPPPIDKTAYQQAEAVMLNAFRHCDLQQSVMHTLFDLATRRLASAIQLKSQS